MRNRGLITIQAMLLALILMGCELPGISGNSVLPEGGRKAGKQEASEMQEGEKEEPEDTQEEDSLTGKTERDVSGYEAYRSIPALGEYRFDPAGKSFSGGAGAESVNPGLWTLTDERSFGEEFPNGYDIWRWDFEDTYTAGGILAADLTFRLEPQNMKEDKNVFAAIYFADAEEGTGELSEKLTVREYFKKTQGSYDPVEMNHFNQNTDGIEGRAEGSDGDLEYYYRAECAFPRLVAEGDRIWAVLDVYASDDTLLTRYLYEYTFRPLDPASIQAAEPEDHEGDPDYEKEEYPGHWVMTDVRYIGGEGEEVRDGEMTIKAERYGAEGQEMVYTFTKDGELQRVRIPRFRLNTSEYAGGFFYQELRVEFLKEPDPETGRVIGALALSEVDFDSGKYGTKVEPKVYFARSSVSPPVESFQMPEAEEDGDPNVYIRPTNCFIALQGSFPEGEKAGDKIWLTYGFMDGYSGNVRMYNLYEYTWVPGPDIYWNYNPGMTY